MSPYLPAIETHMQVFYQSLSEKARRHYAAIEAHKLGRGGRSYIARVLGCSRRTITQGLHDLCEPEPGERTRIRRPGGGRKLVEEKNPTLVAVLEQMLSNENEIAGDPMGKQKWVRSSTRRLSARLAEAGYQVSHTTVCRLLKDMDFSLKTNKRKQGSSKHPERDKQFQYIAAQRQVFTGAGSPIISVDTKKKELIGDYRNQGRVWCRQAEEVNEHDFPDAAECRAVPFGIYDVTSNAGYVMVGTSNDTPEFAVNAIARWWEDEGRAAYPSAEQLLILADGGGSNGSRVRAWKLNLQAKVSDKFGITVMVCHYPPGCSKWNPVEHRLFSQISSNWAGKPLRTLEITLGYIRGTTTTTGLKVTASLDDAHYKKRQKVTQEDFAELLVSPHNVCPSWNYTHKAKTIMMLNVMSIFTLRATTQ
jgi:transposase